MRGVAQGNCFTPKCDDNRITVLGSKSVTKPRKIKLSRTPLVIPTAPLWGSRTSAGHFNTHVNHRILEYVPQVSTRFIFAGRRPSRSAF